MLKLEVLDEDEKVVLKFEHSLLSLSKWEARNKKAFLTRDTKTPSELVDYFADMLVSPEDRTDLVYSLSPAQMDQLTDYMNDPQTASSVPQEKNPSRFAAETVTTELIYYWLTELRIPFHPTETWHINRLMMLVQITNYKKQPPKKRKPTEVMNDWRVENARRLKMLGTSG